jgi:hypothetical protein
MSVGPPRRPHGAPLALLAALALPARFLETFRKMTR